MLKPFVELSKSDIEGMNLGHLQSYRIIQKILKQGFGYLYGGKLIPDKIAVTDYRTHNFIKWKEPDSILYFSDITDFNLDELCNYFGLSGLYRLKYDWLLKKYNGEDVGEKFPNWRISRYSVDNHFIGEPEYNDIR